MKDPYKVLGVSPSSSDEEIKNAYRALAKKYHPDQYAGNPLQEIADEKMKEINEAYDTIVAQRKNGNAGGYSSGYGRSSYGGYGYTGTNTNYGNTDFADVRRFINMNRITDAEQILNGVPGERRNAEWNFLKGSCLYRRGYLEEARDYFSRACEMDPSNREYASAYNQAMNYRAGNYGGYNPNMTGTGSCNTCDVCNTLICADCCCEMMGGDLIPCC
ncbi:MAG: DnaJ domain-containing protein [Clostridia bacterium]|nr:DnaJ domain-containing protein [Clostridia bacterium]